jgi:adenosine deaminase
LQLNTRTPPADLAVLPKAELHVHLEGTIRPSTREEFAARSGSTISKELGTWEAFLAAYMAAWQSMTTPGDYRRLVREYCEDAARAGVRYAELQLTTTFRPYDCLAEAAEEADRQTDVVIRLIVDGPRALPPEVSWRMLDAAKGNPFVVAMGLGGEESFGPELFADVFAEARARGLRSAPHAGELEGPSSIRGAIDLLAADRIMHGVRAVEDAALVAELASSGLPLAVCPTSNILLGIFPSYEAHSLRELWDAGIHVTINTDDPGFFGCDLTGEYALAGRMLDLDRDGYARLARNSVEASFGPNDVKSSMLAGIAEWQARG